MVQKSGSSKAWKGERLTSFVLLHFGAFELFMVEAPGIEPGSGSTTSKRLHAYLTYFNFGTRNAGKRALVDPIPFSLA